MIRRSPIRLAAVTVAAAAVVSGCSTFSDADVVAHVGDAEISNDDFELLADEFFANPDVFGTSPAADGRGDAEQARALLGAMVRQQIINGFLTEQQIEASEIRQAFKDSVLVGSPVSGLSDEMQNLVADTDEALRTETVAGAETPNIDQLRSLYADNPAKTGMICARHILLDTEADAESVLDDLRAGADFATVATERSVDPSAADLGGALTNGDNQCIPLQTMLSSFDPDFTAGALQAREGVPSEPVESSFGWHVILHRPWDEVAASVEQLHQPGESGALLFDGFAATTEVEIDARFGVWDPVRGLVAAIG